MSTTEIQQYNLFVENLVNQNVHGAERLPFFVVPQVEEESGVGESKQIEDVTVIKTNTVTKSDDQSRVDKVKERLRMKLENRKNKNKQ